MSKAGAKKRTLEIVVFFVVICPRLSLHVQTHLLQKVDNLVKND
jgi:hypothetical protein